MINHQLLTLSPYQSVVSYTGHSLQILPDWNFPYLKAQLTVQVILNFPTVSSTIYQKDYKTVSWIKFIQYQPQYFSVTINTLLESQC